MQIKIHIQIKYICIYIIYLFETIVQKAWPSSSVESAKTCKCLFTLSNAKMGEVLQSVSRQARLQRVLRQRLRNPWSKFKSQIEVFNQVEFQHVTVLPKITWGLVQRPKSAIFSFSACRCMYVCMYVCYRFFGTRFFPHHCTD